MRYIILKITIIALYVLFSIASEATVRIAVIDSGLSLSHKSKVPICDDGKALYNSFGINKDVWNEQPTHGDNIVFTIMNSLKTKDYCFIIIKVFNVSRERLTTTQFTTGLLMPSVYNADFINMSFSGLGGDEMERGVIDRLLTDGAVISVAAGNDGLDLNKSCRAYPACYKFTDMTRFHVVGAYDPDHPTRINKRVNYGDQVITDNADECSSAGGLLQCGTSQSTAYITAELINKQTKKEEK